MSLGRSSWEAQNFLRLRPTAAGSCAVLTQEQEQEQGPYYYPAASMVVGIDTFATPSPIGISGIVS